MSYKKKQKHTYINLMADVINSKNPSIIKKELKNSNFKVSKKDIELYLDKELEIESRKIDYSCEMNEIFNNDVQF